MKTFGPSLWVILAAPLLLCASPARAHVEAAELGADIVWDRTSARLELRVAVRELISAEQPLDAVVAPDWNQDPAVVMKRNEKTVLDGFEIRYDGKPLSPWLVSSSVQDLVVGVSEEDIIPRKCAVFALEFTGGGNEAGPARIDLSMSMFKLPLDAGFQPTVLCVVAHRPVNSQTTRTVVIGHEDSLTLKPQWTGEPAAAAIASGASVTKTIAPAPAAVAGRSRGPMIVLSLGGIVAIVLLIVLARQKA